MTSEKQNTADSYHNFSEFYDLYVGDFLDDLPMYEKYAGQVGGPVLEIGAWSGRSTIPLAQTGFDVAAMDVSATMLAILDDRLIRTAISSQKSSPDHTGRRLRTRFGREIRSRHGPVLRVQLSSDTGGAEPSAGPHQGASCRFRTRDCGRLHPYEKAGLVCRKTDTASRCCKLATGNRIRRWNTFRLDTQSSMEYRFQRFEIESPNGELQVKEFTVERRYTLADDLERLFLSHGFKVSQVFTGYLGEPPQPDSEQLVYIFGVD